MHVEIQQIEDVALKKKVLLKLTNAKPLGALGVLGGLGLQVALIQKTETPVLRRPAILVFAADHGIVEEHFMNQNTGDTTYQSVLKFLNESALLNTLVTSNAIKLQVVDVGVARSFEDSLNYWLFQDEGFSDKKIASGTQNFLEKPAMSSAMCDLAMKYGANTVQAQKKLGTNVIGLSDISTDNAASASVLSAALLDVELNFILDNNLAQTEKMEQYRAQILEKAYRKHPKTHDAKTLLTIFGGFEIAALVGAYLKAAQLRMVILVDGFVSTAALLCATRFNAHVLDYCVFCHQEAGIAHAQILKEFKPAQPLLNLQMKKGEGAGIALAYPIVKSAVKLLNKTGERKN